MAIANPDKYVLKPQKEGGGNNFYGEELRKKLLAVEHEPDVRSLLLMEKIRPPIVPAYSVRDGKLNAFDCVCELGLFSSLFTRYVDEGEAKNEVLHEELLGLLFRTKGVHFNEGGISSGAAVLDYPFLVPVDVLRSKAKDLPADRLKCSVSKR
jgi:glutathione synthase